ncbi:MULTISPECIES: DUF1173 family protein [Pseudomonas]|uniref:DUF1173 family protein n=1 Tax=Pseudomonas TaxID=286 RepID=UPI0029138EBB|nr:MULTISPECIES: DUF1173 family protein [Pseudomonas]MDU8545715.1 DUF1173 family protein [Pseudomonas syringae group sp. J248-6]WPP02582.1 DUF1173 family protein [Pseudomonas sp. HR96]
MTDRHPIEIVKTTGPQVYTVSFQTDSKFAAQWQSALRSAHQNKLHVSCCCAGTGPRRFSVRYMSGSDSYHLARYAHTGQEHALDCGYYTPDPDKSGLSGYSKGVIEETSDGDLRIKLTLSLRKQDPADAGEPRAERTGTQNARATKPAMTLLGLLHLLWTEAELNVWSPGMAGKRDTSLIHRRLALAANRITTHRLRLDDSLVVATVVSGGTQEKANAGKVASAIRNNRRLLVIAPLAAYSLERAEGTPGFIAIKGFHGVPKLSYDAETWASVCRRFKRELSAWSQGKRVIAIVQTDTPTSSEAAQALNIALMVVSDEWVPVDSSYESVIEAKLRTEGRRFYKPLRYDAEADAVFPDFWLLDLPSNREYPMEVYGRSDDKYLKRKAVKTEHYAAEYGAPGCWSWNAADDTKGLAIPDFPAAKQ